MTRDEFYKLTDILNSEVLGNFMHGGEADELIAMFEEAVERSNILEQEESVSEELEEAAINHAVERYRTTRDRELAEKCKWSFKTGAKWQKDKMIQNAIDAQCFGFQGAALFSFRLPADNYLVGSKIKVIVIKED